MRPDLDAKVLRDGWYVTGDMGYLAAGQLYVSGRKNDLINATVLAGSGLEPSQEKFPSTVLARIAPKLGELLKHLRPAQPGGPLMSDDACDLDYADAELRLEWRRLVFETLGPKILGD